MHKNNIFSQYIILNINECSNKGEYLMYKAPYKPPIEQSCLIAINHQRNTICEKLNDKCYETMALKGGNEEQARKYYYKMLQLVDVATMLDILTNDERELFYDKIHQFFSGIQIQLFELLPLSTHHFEDYSVIDLILVYKINIQEKINENLRLYREFDKEKFADMNKKDLLSACENILEFAKDFSFLKEEEIKTARDIISNHRKNKEISKDKEKIIYVPENFYTKVPN